MRRSRRTAIGVRMTTRRLLANAGSVVSSEAVNRATTFVLYIVVARYFDDTTFGRLALALSLLFMTQVAAGFGLSTYLAREVAKNQERAGTYLPPSLLIGLTSSVLSLGLLGGLVAVVGYPTATREVIMLIALAAVPFAVTDVCNGLFMAFERMHLILFVGVPTNVLKVVVAFALLGGGFGIEAVVWPIVGSQVAAALLSLALALRLVAPTWQGWRPERQQIRSIIGGASTFLGINAVSAMWSTLPIFVLSLFVAESEVGLFGAASQLLSPVSLVLNAVLIAAFPMMARSFDIGSERLRTIAHGLLAVLLAVAIPASLGLILVAPQVMTLIYGAGFETASTALQIMAPILVLRVIATALGRSMEAGMLERVNLRIVTLNSVVALILGLILAPRFGVTGAAVATLVTVAFNVMQHHAPATRLIGRIRFLSLAWRPLVAGGAMTAMLLAARPLPLLPAVLLGAVTYSAALMILHWATLGRPPQLWQRLTRSWMEP